MKVKWGHSILASARKIAALLKPHRSPTVQLYALSLAEALSKSYGIVLYRELSFRVFTQGLERPVTDRRRVLMDLGPPGPIQTTHDRAPKRALGLISMWIAGFEHDTSLGVMEECYNSLRVKSTFPLLVPLSPPTCSPVYRFETPNEPPPLTVEGDVCRREEEELQRVLEMSIDDRSDRNGHVSAQSSSLAGRCRCWCSGIKYCLRSHLSIRLRSCAVTARNLTHVHSPHLDIPCTSCGSSVSSGCDICTCITHR